MSGSDREVVPGGRKGRSLFWTFAGLFLLTVVVGTLGQFFFATSVLRPLEEREHRARAELVASTLADELAQAPQPVTQAALDSIANPHREQLGSRRAWVAYQTRDGAIVTIPPDRGELFAAALAGRKDPERRGGLEFLGRAKVIRGNEVLGEALIARPIRPQGGRGRGPFGWGPTLLFLPVAL